MRSRHSENTSPLPVARFAGKQVDNVVQMGSDRLKVVRFGHGKELRYSPPQLFRSVDNHVRKYTDCFVSPHKAT